MQIEWIIYEIMAKIGLQNVIFFVLQTKLLLILNDPAKPVMKQLKLDVCRPPSFEQH